MPIRRFGLLPFMAAWAYSQTWCTETLILGGPTILCYGWPLQAAEHRIAANTLDSGRLLLEERWRFFSSGLLADIVLAAVSLAAVAVQGRRWFHSTGRFQFRLTALLGLSFCVVLTMLIYRYELDLWIALSGMVTHQSRDASALIRNSKLFFLVEEHGSDWYLWVPLFFSIASAVYLAGRLCSAALIRVYLALLHRVRGFPQAQ